MRLVQAGRAGWSRLAGIITGAVLLTVLQILAPVQAEDRTLESIDFSALPGDRIEINLQLSGDAGSPLSFAIDNPARIALDFPATSLALPSKNVPVGVGMAQSISAVEAGGRTRVVVNLVRMVPYQISTDGNMVKVTLESSGGSAATAAASSMPNAPASTSAGAVKRGTENAITGIDFRRGERGEGRVMVTLSNPSAVVDMREEGGQILVDFLNSTLPDELARRLDVLDFATPIKTVDTLPQGNGVRMKITPIGDYEHLAYQSDNLMTIEVKPLSKAQQEEMKKKKFGYTGERLSLNFQDIEVRAVLQLIADFTGLNLVASDTVSGNVTLRLKNVPWDQAMDIILRSKGLSMRQDGNVIMVAPTEEIATREKLELEAQQQISELSPLRTEFVQVNYAKASDVAGLIQAEGASLMSERGTVSVDARTNTLLVQDTSERLSDIRDLVTKLDIPIRQVLIDTRIVIASEDFSKELGVKFGLSGAGVYKGPDHTYNVGGTRGGGFENTVTAFDTGGSTDGLLVNLPVTAAAGSLGLVVGNIGSHLLQLELSALQAEGRGEVISNPRIITANQKEAIIKQGTEIPYQEASSSGATSTSFKEAVLSLSVTPQITPDDRIIMDLKISNDSVGELAFGGIPTIETRDVSTQVLVDNGETVVLGGVYVQTTRDDVTKVPFFGDLPYLGHAFRQTSVTDDKDELLIFVTPKILKEALTLN